MPHDLTLSEELQDYINTREADYDRELPVEEKQEREKLERLVKGVVLYVLKSRETVISPYQSLEEIIREAPDLTRFFLDEHYTKKMVGDVADYVRRTLELSHMEAKRTPSNVTNTYLREATRTYILGLPQACVALSRAALEQSLKESLGRQLSGVHLSFQELVREGVKWNVLDESTAKKARNLANEGDAVLHEAPTSLTKAKEVLMGMRRLVQHIYSSTGRY